MALQSEYHYYINSDQRISKIDSDFTYSINLHDNIVDCVIVLAASIPKSYYQIPPNSTFGLIEGVLSATVPVNTGSYSVDQIKTEIQNKLILYSPNSYTYFLNFSSITGLFTFTVSNNAGAQPTFIIPTSSLHEILGFSPNTYQFSGDTLVSQHVVNANRESTLFIHSNICSNKSGDDILQEIYTVKNLSNTYISFKNFTPKYYTKSLIKNKNTFRFYLCDENRNKIDLNGINMCLTLFIYKSDNTHRMLTQFMKFITHILAPSTEFDAEST